MDGTFDASSQIGIDPFPAGCTVKAAGERTRGLGTVIRSTGEGSYLVSFASGERCVVERYKLTKVVPPVRRPPKRPQAPLRFLSYDEMVALPEPEWLIEGLLMAETSALLFGRSNSFKSFLGIDIACTVACSDPHEGRSSWHGQRVAEGYSVLYIATEGALGVAKQRIPGWKEAHGIPARDRNCISLYPEEIALDDDRAVDDLLLSSAIHTHNLAETWDDTANWRDPTCAFQLVVIDIFGSTMDGPETSDETARAWVRNINRIKRKMRCAILTVAHTGWADDTRARMHTHFWGSFDTRLRAEGDKDSLSVLLSVDRHKDADSSGEWGFRMEKVAVPDSDTTTLIPRLSDEVKGGQRRRVSGKPAVALQALSEALIDQGHVIAGPNFPNRPVVTTEQWRVMCDKHGLTDSDNPEATRKAFNRARTTLLEKDLIRQFEGYVWKVSDDD